MPRLRSHGLPQRWSAGFLHFVMGLMFAGFVLPASGMAFEAIPQDLLRRMENFSLSPDETEIAAEIVDPETGTTDIFLLPIERPQLMRRLTALEGAELPRFSPRGTYLSFVYDDAVYVMDRSGANKRHVADLAADIPADQSPATWFTDELVLLYGIEWPEYDVPDRGVTSHMAVQQVDGPRRWVAGVHEVDGPSSAAANPRVARMAWVVDGRLMTVSLDLEEMFLLGLADEGSSLTYSPESALIAFQRDGDLRIVRSDGSRSWNLGPGSSPTFPDNSDTCLFLRESDDGPLVMAWRRQTGQVLPLGAVLQERQEIRSVLAEADRKATNLLECLGVTRVNLESQDNPYGFPAMERLTSAFAKLDDDEYLGKTDRRETYEDLSRGLSSFTEEMKWQASSVNVLMDRLVDLTENIDHLSANLLLGVDQLPYAEGILRQVNEIAEASGPVEAEAMAMLAAAERQKGAIRQFSAAFSKAKTDMIAAEDLARRQRLEEFQATRELYLRRIWQTVGIVFTAVVASLLLLYLYGKFVAPRLRLRKIRKQYDQELRDNLKVVQATLQKASTDLHKEKRKEVAWERILSNTQGVLNDVFQDTHRRELDRIEKLGDFYQRVTAEIIALNISEEQKVELLDSFKKLMREGLEDSGSETPFQQRLKDIYTRIAD